MEVDLECLADRRDGVWWGCLLRMLGLVRWLRGCEVVRAVVFEGGQDSGDVEKVKTVLLFDKRLAAKKTTIKNS